MPFFFCERQLTNDSRFYDYGYRHFGVGVARGVKLVARLFRLSFYQGFAALFFVAFLLPGHASTTLSQFPPNPGVLPGGGWKLTPGSTFADPPPPRAWVNGTYGGVPGVKATDALTLKGPAGNLPVSVSRSATLGAVGAAAARCLGNPICMAGAAVASTLISEGLERSRIYPESSNPERLRHDPGVDPITQQGYEYGEPWNDYWGSASGACEHYAGHRAEQAWVEVVSSNVVGTAPNNLQCRYTYKFHCAGDPSSGPRNCTAETSAGTLSYRTAQITQCPASIDALNPAYSIPAGQPVGPDGKCKTARYNHVPIGVTAAGEKFAMYPPTNPSAVADAALKGGEIITPSAWEGTIGPASQVGPSESTTETSSTGTKATTKTPTYTYNYGGDTITYNQSWTTVTNNNGDITTTVTNPPPVQSTEQDPTNPCTQNPEAAGCQKLDVPTGDNLPTKTIQASALPDSGWGSDNGTCPGLVHTTLVGDVDPFGLICTYMGGIRFAVIGFAGLIAALIFIGRLD